MKLCTQTETAFYDQSLKIKTYIKETGKEEDCFPIPAFGCWFRTLQAIGETLIHSALTENEIINAYYHAIENNYMRSDCWILIGGHTKIISYAIKLLTGTAPKKVLFLRQENLDPAKGKSWGSIAHLKFTQMAIELLRQNARGKWFPHFRLSDFDPIDTDYVVKHILSLRFFLIIL